MPQSRIGRLLIVVLAVAAAGAALALFIPAVQWRFVDYGAKQRAELNPAPLADDGSLYTMPIGSDEVRIGRLNN